MVDYIVTDRDGAFLMEGDALHSVEGTRAVFGGVAGFDPEGGGMLILADGRAEYASYWNVDVDVIDDEYDYEWAEYGQDDDWTGYYPEDEYFGDLDREYDDIY